MSRDLIPVNSKHDKAIDAVREFHPNGENFKVTRTLSLDDGFFKSTLLYVEYDQPSPTGAKSNNNVVYMPEVGDPVVRETEGEFIVWFAGKRRQPSGLLPKLVEASGGIAGVIAIMIVAVILWQYAHATHAKEFEIPETLSSAFTLILGYYFGSKANGGRANT